MDLNLLLYSILSVSYVMIIYFIFVIGKMKRRLNTLEDRLFIARVDIESIEKRMIKFNKYPVLTKEYN
jgi:hypothetical protein